MVLKNNPCIYVGIIFYGECYMENKFLSPEINQKIYDYCKNTITDSLKFYLYIHIVPKEINSYGHDKYYVGITSRHPKIRWMNGLGYKTQMFYRAIEKYGWDNIEHKIIASNLSQTEAEELEKEIILYLKSNQPEYGYNIASGGMFVGGHCVKIAQYDLDGNFIKSYPSIGNAALEINQNKESGGIRWALSQEGRTWKGFMWREYEEDPIPKIEPYIPYDCRTPILQYDLYGNFIKEWDSLKEASDYYKTYCISNACRQLAPTAVGFQWKYKNDDRIIKDIHNSTNKKTIYVYTLDGQFINQYESISDAVRKLNIPINRSYLDVSNCYADIRKNSSHGYRWCDTYYDKLPPLLQRGKPIIQLNNNKQIINIFNNMNMATNETSESRSTITNSSNKDRLTKRGYYWKFASDISSDNLNFINEDIKEKYYEMTA